MRKPAVLLTRHAKEHFKTKQINLFHKTKQINLLNRQKGRLPGNGTMWTAASCLVACGMQLQP